MPHRILNPQTIALRKTFPWAFSIQKILHADRPRPFDANHLLVGSDYGGHHSGSSYRTYAFLVASNLPSPWLTNQRSIRAKYLPDGRRMSFKRLSDSRRQESLVPFLQAADELDGHIVVFVVHKSVRLHPTKKEDIAKWTRLLGLSANWRRRAFEEAIRKCHFFSLLVSQWSRPMMDVTWISDEDEFVADEARLDDMQKFSARFSTLYLPHSMRQFAMNTTKIDDESREYEDFVAIPDLAAGMLSELSSHLAKSETWYDLQGKTFLNDGEIQAKSELLLDWFWFGSARLKRTCIVIDKSGKQSRVFKLNQLFS